MSEKKSRTVGGSIEETRRYHTFYLRAINSPIRREILRVLKGGSATLDDLQASTGLGREALRWHLSVLERGFCVEKAMEQGKAVYRITQEGMVVDRLE